MIAELDFIYLPSGDQRAVCDLILDPADDPETTQMSDDDASDKSHECKWYRYVKTLSHDSKNQFI